MEEIPKLIFIFFKGDVFMKQFLNGSIKEVWTTKIGFDFSLSDNQMLEWCDTLDDVLSVENIKSDIMLDDHVITIKTYNTLDSYKIVRAFDLMINEEDENVLRYIKLEWKQ